MESNTSLESRGGTSPQPASALALQGVGGTAAASPESAASRGGTSTVPKKGSTFLTAPGVASLVNAARAQFAAGQRHKASKHSDSGGLFLFIDAQARASWRVKFRVRSPDGRLVERLTSLGPVAGYSTAANAITLAQAREQLKVVKGDLAGGNDPVQQAKLRERDKAVDNAATFGVLAKEWLTGKTIPNKEGKKPWSEIHYLKASQAFERDVLPVLSALPVSAIKVGHINQVLKAVADRGAIESAHRLRQHIGQVMRKGIARGLITFDPSVTAAEDLDTQYKRGKRPAFLTFPQLGDVLRKIEATRISPGARLANDLLCATLVRISELMGARWAEFKLDAEQPHWTIPRSRMKEKDRDYDHVVPLPAELAERLKKWKAYCEGSPFVFPGEGKGGTISIATLEKLYSRTLGLGGKHCPHGWRASFSTLARQQVGKDGRALFDDAAIEVQQDHAYGNATSRAYDRPFPLEPNLVVLRWDARLAVMRWWWAALEQAKNGADVIRLPAVNRAA